VAPAVEGAALERLRDTITEELNVKDVRLTADAAELVDYALKPNCRCSVPRWQADRAGAAALEQLEQAAASAFVAALGAAGQADLTLTDGTQVTLTADEVLVETRARLGSRSSKKASSPSPSTQLSTTSCATKGWRARSCTQCSSRASPPACDRRHDQPGSGGASRIAASDRALCRHHKVETLASEFELGAATRDYVETARVEGHELIIGISARHDLHRHIRLTRRLILRAQTGGRR